MVVALCQATFSILSGPSAAERRSALRALSDIVRRELKAELLDLNPDDLRERPRAGSALVARDAREAEQKAQRLRRLLIERHEAELIHWEQEILTWKGEEDAEMRAHWRAQRR